jgi:predicted short-subunit dehydrogenase-like oxidoreductase (DUF2520 family)
MTVEGATTTVRFVVVGAGRLGASLALALRNRGSDLAGFTARTFEGRANAESWLRRPSCTSLAELSTLAPQLVVIAVPDQALPPVARELAPLLVPPSSGGPVFVAHTSGATSVRVLEPCAQAGALTFAFHPLQTFSDPVAGAGRFAGAAIAITPAESQPADGRLSPSARLGFGLAHTLGATPFLLPDGKRSLYHAAAAMACNYLVTLQHEAARLFVSAGLPANNAVPLFLPLVETTLANIARQGTVDALTGPLSRGDVTTIAGHLQALTEEAPDLLPLYRGLGLATLDLVRRRGEVSPATMEELAAVLAGAGDPSKPFAPDGGEHWSA